jgi:hypothetical protein
MCFSFLRVVIVCGMLNGASGKPYFSAIRLPLAILLPQKCGFAVPADRVPVFLRRRGYDLKSVRRFSSFPGLSDQKQKPDGIQAAVQGDPAHSLCVHKASFAARAFEQTGVCTLLALLQLG